MQLASAKEDLKTANEGTLKYKGAVDSIAIFEKRIADFTEQIKKLEEELAELEKE